MSYDLTIDFTGLCTFVTNDAPEWLRVILLRDTTGAAPHAPRLTFDVRDKLDFKGTDSISNVVQLPNGAQIASWDLSGKILELSGVDTGTPNTVLCCGPKTPEAEEPRDPPEELNFCWVPSLERLCGKGEVKPAFKGDDPGLNGPVGARFDTKRGFLFSNAEVNRTLQPGGVFEFQPGGKRQYLSDAVRLEIRGLTKAVELKAKTFGGQEVGVLRLETKKNKAIALSLTNLPVLMPENAEEHHEHGAGAINHFKMYYGLLDQAPASFPVPEPAVAGPQVVAGLFPARCTPSSTP